MSYPSSSSFPTPANLDNIQVAIFNAFRDPPSLPLVIAYSGGVDSQVILHAFSVLKKRQLLMNPISVCHINHGLSPHAVLWEKNAERYCLTYGFPLEIKRVKLKHTTQTSLEAVARDARYQALSEYAENEACIVTGHHGDDQVETFLLALKRGAGLKGLSAMKTCITLNIHPEKSLKLVRPLLKVSREDILTYAQKSELTWVEDESNSDVRFERNFLRHDVIPRIKNRWPSFLTTLFRSTEHIQESQVLLDELAEQDLKTCCNAKKRLMVMTLLTLSQARFNNLVRFYLAQQHWLMPSTEQLVQAYQQMLATQGQSLEVKLGEVWLRVFKAEVYFTHLLPDLTSWQCDINNSVNDIFEKITLPHGLGELTLTSQALSQRKNALTEKHKLKPPAAGQKIEIRFVHNNPICLPDYRNKSRPLKKVLQELTIPPWERKQVPFLYYDGELVAAIGHFVCKPFITDDEKAWFLYQ